MYYSSQELLQQALFKAAKTGHISLMREFLLAGANPFERDAENYTAFHYAMAVDPIKTNALLIELEDIIEKRNKRGGDVQ